MKHTLGHWKARPMAEPVEGQESLWEVVGFADNAAQTPILIANNLREPNARLIADAVNAAIAKATQ